MVKKTPTVEIGFMATNCTEEGLHINQAIDIMCNQLIYIEKDKKLLAKALKEVAKTPTGRMAIWATYHDLTYDTDTRKNVVSESNTGLYARKLVETRDNSRNIDCLGFVILSPDYKNVHDVVHVFPDRIDEVIRKKANLHKKNKTLPPEALTDEVLEQAILLEIAGAFLHEFQHSRQGDFIREINRDLHSVHTDAAPQALSQQIRIESLNPLLLKINNISQKDVDDYKKAVHYNEETGEFDVKLATRYSQTAQQRLTIDFASPLSKKPFTDYSRLYYKWRSYITDHVNFIEEDPPPQAKKGMHDYFAQANRVDIEVGNVLPEKLKQIFEPLIKDVDTYLFLDEIEYLEKCMKDLEQPDPEKFEGGKDGIAYKKAMAFYEPYYDVSSKLKRLSELSAQIKAGDKKAIKESNALKAELKEYGFIFHTHNRFGDRISEVAVERKEHTLAQAGDTLPSEVQPETQGLNTLRESQTEVSTPLSPSKERLT